jgi:hypothetical protein
VLGIPAQRTGHFWSIDLNGDLFGTVVQTGLKRPFMVIQSHPGTCSDASCRSFQSEVQAILRTVPPGTAKHLGIPGIKHFNFSDYAVYFSPARLPGLPGSLDGVRGLQWS